MVLRNSVIYIYSKETQHNVAKIVIYPLYNREESCILKHVTKIDISPIYIWDKK